jgi:AcrR family transcriptional regulator
VLATALEPTAADLRRAEVIDVAAALFTRRGYQRTGMEDIASEVGLAKPSLYHYFPSKQVILWAVFQETMRLLRERRVAHIGAPPAEQLRAFIIGMIDFHATHPDYVHVWFELQGELTARQRSAIGKRGLEVRETIKTFVAQGIAEGTFREVDVSLFTSAVTSIVSTTYRWFRPGGRLTAQEAGASFADYLIDGVRKYDRELALNPASDGHRPRQR